MAGAAPKPILPAMTCTMFSLVLALACAIGASTPSVAIIGGGISGAATSFYLQEFLRNFSLPAARIRVFERNDYVGGRLKHINFGTEGTSVEVGGAAWTTQNQYMMELSSKVPINHTTMEARSPTVRNLSSFVAVWNGTAFTKLSELLLRDAVGVAKVFASENAFQQDISQSYVKQKSEAPYKSLETFLSWGDLTKYTQQSLKDYFSAHGAKVDLIEQAMVPLNRAIYNCNSDCDAFTILASLSAELNHHHVHGGNMRLVKALYEAANASTSLNHTVRAIELLPTSTGSRFVVHSKGLNGSEEEVFDKVVICAPLERTGITFLNMSLPETAKIDRGFRDWHVTVVEAEGGLNLTQFAKSKAAGIDPQSSIVLTTATGATSATPYVTVQPLGKHGSGKGAAHVHMVYSDQELDVESLFVGVQKIYRQHWPYTFAKLSPLTDIPTQTQPIVLHDAGLFNANALESIATAMEISAMGGRNAARLVVESLGSAQTFV